MFPPTLANSGGRGLSRSFLNPLRFGLRELAENKIKKKKESHFIGTSFKSHSREPTCTMTSTLLFYHFLLLYSTENAFFRVVLYVNDNNCQLYLNKGKGGLKKIV